MEINLPVLIAHWLSMFATSANAQQTPHSKPWFFTGVTTPVQEDVDKLRKIFAYVNRLTSHRRRQLNVKQVSMRS